ncbi:MAG TPA: hypothetical protein VK961_23065 [Chthoniobacter sp.]|nr:hypothetical protein [Chthoniobacter sp.]
MHDRQRRASFQKSRLREVVDWLFSREWRRSHWLVALIWIAALLTIQWRAGQGFITQANHDLTRHDQDAYLALARANLPFIWPAYADGIHAPLFPFLIKSWAGEDNAQFFTAAKEANVLFGMGATVLLAIYFLRKLPPLPAMNVGTISALIILPASAFVTPEVIYYTAFFFFWVVGWRLLVRNPLSAYALAGVLCAATYLAKPSTLLLSACLVALSLWRWKQVESSGTEDTTWTGRRFLIGFVVSFLCFLIPVLPKAYDAYQRTGDPFENAAEYCVWMDDAAHCVPLLHDFPNHRFKEWPKAQQPSALNYWNHHSMGQIWARLSSGIVAQANNFLLGEKSVKSALRSYSHIRSVMPLRGAYPLALLLGTFLLATQSASGKSRTLTDRHMLWALAALGFTVHFLAISFYTPIVNGDRLILAVYIPVLFSLALGIEYLREERANGWRVEVVQVIHMLIAGHLAWSLIQLSLTGVFGEPRDTM